MQGKATAMTIGDGGSNVWIISDDESLDDNEGDKEEYTDSRANEKQISSTSNKSDHQKMEVVDLEGKKSFFFSFSIKSSFPRHSL